MLDQEVLGHRRPRGASFSLCIEQGVAAVHENALQEREGDSPRASGIAGHKGVTCRAARP